MSLITRLRCAWRAYWLRGDISYLDEVIAAYRASRVDPVAINALIKQRAQVTVRLILNETGELA